MASSVRVRLPSYGYNYTFTGVLSVKHEYSLNCTLLLQSGNISIKETSAHMGHAQTSATLNIYAHKLRRANERARDALMGERRKAD